MRAPTVDLSLESALGDKRTNEDGIWIAESPAIPGCASHGSARDKALTNVREAIALCLEVRSERGLPLTIETRQIEVTV